MNIKENVMLGDFKSYDDLGLIFKGKTISAPTVKTNKVSVPGRNGSIDYSEILGGIRYENRKITMRFQIYAISRDLITAKMSELMMKLHGQAMHIIFADDEAYFWKGRLTVGDPKISKGFIPYVDINITADVDPYKYSIYTTDEDWLWNPFDFDNGIVNELSDIFIGSGERKNIDFVTLPDDRVTAPIITCSVEGTTARHVSVTAYKKEGSSFIPITRTSLTVHKGSHVFYDIPLEKNNEYRFEFWNRANEDAVISINYLGGSL